MRFPAYGFLVVFYSNHSPKMHHSELGSWNRWTDKQINGLKHCLCPLPLWWQGGIITDRNTHSYRHAQALTGTLLQSHSSHFANTLSTTLILPATYAHTQLFTWFNQRRPKLLVKPTPQSRTGGFFATNFTAHVPLLQTSNAFGFGRRHMNSL